MKALKQYSIPFTGLKNGQHQFNYDVDFHFFNEFEYSLVKNGLLKVDLVLDKQETMMVLEFHIQGSIFLSCDKCLADFPYQLDTKDRLIAKFSDIEEELDSEEVVILTKNENEIDVSPFIYEMINLAAPYINLCEDPGNMDSCDQEMLAKVAELSEGQEEKIEKSDPRWDILKNIRKN
ncbi:MAG: DUF177 domain-containing protein [Pelobium sp.]